MAVQIGVQEYSPTYVTVQASAVVPDNTFSGGTLFNIATAMPTTSKDYLLDFKAIVSASTPNAGSRLDLYKRNSDQSPPSLTNLNTFVGTFKLDATTGNYYKRGVVNDDELDTYYVHNLSGVQTNIELLARTRTYGTEV